MADKTGIAWTSATWNPVVGCSLASPACTRCYAMSMAARIVRMARAEGRVSHYEGTTTLVKGIPVWTGKLALSPTANFLRPVRWQKPRRIFVDSMSDLFHEDMPVDWIDRTFAAMRLGPVHVFQILTKRPAVMRAYMSDPATPTRIGAAARALLTEVANPPRIAPGLVDDARWPPPNVVLGCTVEDQRRAEERLPDLLATPAALHFASIEPMLTQVLLREVSMPDGSIMNALVPGTLPDGTPRAALGWAIVGGESGPVVRPMHPAWADRVRVDCEIEGIPFFFKQWGVWGPTGDAEDAVVGTTRIVASGIAGIDPAVMRKVAKVEDDVLGGMRYQAFPDVLSAAA